MNIEIATSMPPSCSAASVGVWNTVCFLGLAVLCSAATGTRAEQFESVNIRVDEPAGPPPLGGVAEASVPFAEGALKTEQIEGLTVAAPGGEPVPTQARAVWRWLDGSVRWLFVTFDATAGPGVYRLVPGARPPGGPLLREEGDALVVDTGPLVMRLPRSDMGWFQSIAARDAQGNPVEVVRGTEDADLILTAPPPLRRGGQEGVTSSSSRGWCGSNGW